MINDKYKPYHKLKQYSFCLSNSDIKKKPVRKVVKSDWADYMIPFTTVGIFYICILTDVAFCYISEPIAGKLARD